MRLLECINRFAEIKKEVINMDVSLTLRGDGRHQSGQDEVIVS